MKKNLRIIILIVTLLMLAIMVTGCVQHEPTEEEQRIEDLEEQVAQYEEQVTDLNGQINQLTEENENLQMNAEYYEALSNEGNYIFFTMYFYPEEEGMLYEDADMEFYTTPNFFDGDPYTGNQFVSDESIKVETDDGLTVYASMSVEGLVWSAKDPRFDPIVEEVEEEE